MSVSAVRRLKSARVDRSRAVVSLDEQTPIDSIDGILYKREDLFLPFAEIDLNGGKLRQAYSLVRANLEHITRNCDATIFTATGVHSLQGLIISRVAQHFDLKCRLFLGAVNEATILARHVLLETAVYDFGAELDTSCRVAYSTALAARIFRYQQETGRAGFIIRFGMNLDSDRESIIETTAAQCKNIPETCSTIVITVGSAITAGGLFEGLRKYAPQVRRVICVQIAGYQRKKTLDAISSFREYEFYVTTKYPYSRRVHRRVGSLVLDPIYESKAHEYMCDSLDLAHDDSVLFWNVANNSAFYEALDESKRNGQQRKSRRL